MGAFLLRPFSFPTAPACLPACLRDGYFALFPPRIEFRRETRPPSILTLRTGPSSKYGYAPFGAQLQTPTDADLATGCPAQA